jgi:hypothetical protein
MIGYPFSLFHNIFTMFKQFFVKKNILPPAAPAYPIVSFIIARHRKFTRTFDNSVNSNFSSNIDDVFYDKKKLFQTMLIDNNHLEKEWKTRIMIDTTPRGNLIMFYDVYKQGFAYYSDQNSLPYAVLNGAAMKYVIMFGCRDFYMDENFLPEDYVSPLVKIFLEDDKPDKNDSDDIEADIKTKPVKIDTKSGPFAKLKNYRFDEQKQPPNFYYNAVQTQKRSLFELTTIAFTNLFRWSIIGIRRTYLHLFIKPTTTLKNDVMKTDVEKKPIKEKNVNKFINMGKTYNFSILQKIPIGKPQLSTIDTQFDGFFSETNTRSVVTDDTTIPISVSGSVIPRVNFSAVSKNPNYSMSWQQYKTKISEEHDYHII